MSPSRPPEAACGSFTCGLSATSKRSDGAMACVAPHRAVYLTNWLDSRVTRVRTSNNSCKGSTFGGRPLLDGYLMESGVAADTFLFDGFARKTPYSAVSPSVVGLFSLQNGQFLVGASYLMVI
jgi:hypothetical protein